MGEARVVRLMKRQQTNTAPIYLDKRGAFSPHPLFPSLCYRHVEILQWMADGKRYDDIAEILCLSRTTIQNHVVRIMNKTGTNTAIGAVVMAMRKGLIK